MQEISQKFRLKRLVKALRTSHNGKDLILDDEAYFKLYGHQDNKFFYGGPSGKKDDGKIPNNIKYIGKEKFEPKLMVWMLISPRAASPLVVFPHKQNINGDFYREFVIKKIVKPFIDTHYPDGEYWFWPDSAPGL